VAGGDALRARVRLRRPLLPVPVRPRRVARGDLGRLRAAPPAPAGAAVPLLERGRARERRRGRRPERRGVGAPAADRGVAALLPVRADPALGPGPAAAATPAPGAGAGARGDGRGVRRRGLAGADRARGSGGAGGRAAPARAGLGGVLCAGGAVAAPSGVRGAAGGGLAGAGGGGRGGVVAGGAGLRRAERPPRLRRAEPVRVRVPAVPARGHPRRVGRAGARPEHARGAAALAPRARHLRRLPRPHHRARPGVSHAAGARPDDRPLDRGAGRDRRRRAADLGGRAPRAPLRARARRAVPVRRAAARRAGGRGARPLFRARAPRRRATGRRRSCSTSAVPGSRAAATLLDLGAGRVPGRRDHARPRCASGSRAARPCWTLVRAGFPGGGDPARPRSSTRSRRRPRARAGGRARSPVVAAGVPTHSSGAGGVR
jgi:hypothetical protein